MRDKYIYDFTEDFKRDVQLHFVPPPITHGWDEIYAGSVIDDGVRLKEFCASHELPLCEEVFVYENTELRMTFMLFPAKTLFALEMGHPETPKYYTEITRRS